MTLEQLVRLWRHHGQSTDAFVSELAWYQPKDRPSMILDLLVLYCGQLKSDSLAGAAPRQGGRISVARTIVRVDVHE